MPTPQNGQIHSKKRLRPATLLKRDSGTGVFLRSLFKWRVNAFGELRLL